MHYNFETLENPLRTKSLTGPDAEFAAWQTQIAAIRQNIETVVKGKRQAIDLCLVGLFGRGHVLIEDIPGVGKSTLAQCLCASVGLAFQRIQFTSDLLPSDILGVVIYDGAEKNFVLRKGPVFSNFILADEINRATPKTQSALLEAMNDQQVTIDNTTYPLPNPFMVIATQNPLDHRGTFPLPDSQLDRFMLRLHMGYPDLAHEKEILRNMEKGGPRSTDKMQSSSSTSDALSFRGLKQAITFAELLQIQNQVNAVHVSESVENYLLKIISDTRQSDLLALGASTRGALALAQAAKAYALIQGRSFCLPDDVKALASAVLAHRVVVEHRGAADARKNQSAGDIIDEIISRIPIPV